MEQVDIVVLGAGAAGLMAAATAARRGRRVLVLDHARQPGEKILISGGGRCNFTNRHTTPDRFWSANARFCRSALSRYTPQDFIDLVDRHGIAWHEKTLGQLFCDGSARQIVAMLLDKCATAGATIRVQTKITDITKADRFHIETDRGPIEAESVVIATGGLSIPKIGATGFGLDLARRFGLPVTQVRPGLVPPPPRRARPAYRASPASPSPSAPVAATRASTRAWSSLIAASPAPRSSRSPPSGAPATPSLSTSCPPPPPTPSAPASVLAPRPASAALSPTSSPQRLADAFLPPDLAARPIGEIPDRALIALETALRVWQIHPSGTEGYAKAEVMLGGIATEALSQKTMAAKTVPGLFVIGEAVDVTGWLGGYNFQWAWASGVAAGEAA